ncbi:hypothetical protein KM043_018526 [Ampulex compressa]|nr:hypothetical protein KM043_018526 [Ampulex compressa]
MAYRHGPHGRGAGIRPASASLLHSDYQYAAGLQDPTTTYWWRRATVHALPAMQAGARAGGTLHSRRNPERFLASCLALDCSPRDGATPAAGSGVTPPWATRPLRVPV